MLKKPYRLDSFSLVSPKQVSGKYFSFKYSKNREELNRFAFVVSRKTDPRASARNEMKRKVRAAVEGIFESIASGFDFVFYPKRDTLRVTSKEVSEELKQVLGKENLLNV